MREIEFGKTKISKHGEKELAFFEFYRKEVELNDNKE
jgi:hypothetical protein